MRTTPMEPASVQEAAISDEPVSRRPLYQQVRDRVLRLITDGVLAVGDQLPPERALSASLGVSRHSLRQALSALEAQGMIEIRHGSGAYLIATEPSHVASEMADALIDSSEQLPYVMEARFAIEPFLVGLAAERATTRELDRIRAALAEMEQEIAAGESGEAGDVAFHAAVLDAAKSPVLVDFMRQLQPGVHRLREEALAQPTAPSLAVEAHHAILAALEARDRGRAVRAAQQHLAEAAQALLVSELAAPPHALLTEVLLDATRQHPATTTATTTVPIASVEPVPAVGMLRPYRAGESVDAVRGETGLQTVHKLASNENPYGCSPAATAAVSRAAMDLSAYPDVTAGALREALARHYGVDDEQIVIGNGSDEVLLLVARTFLGPGRTAVACEPTFAQYRAHTLTTGARYVPVATSGDTDLTALADYRHGTSVIWVCNPNNPTGSYLDADGLAQLLGMVGDDTLVVVDEAYAEYATADDFPNTVGLIERHPNLVVTRTFSKIYGLAGLRMGFGIADAGVARLLNTVRSPFNTSVLAQAAATAALGDQDFVRQSRDRNARTRGTIEQFCRQNQLEYASSQANFVLLDAPGGANRVFTGLKQAGIIVRPGTQLGFPSKIRISVGTDDQVDAALTALSHLL